MQKEQGNGNVFKESQERNPPGEIRRFAKRKKKMPATVLKEFIKKYVEEKEKNNELFK